jgi:uncharacterized protein YndB with AHSA1/START domain
MTSLTLIRHIKARPSIVFDALTTPEGIVHWWGCADGPVLIAETDVRAGGRFRVRFRMPSGEEHESAGEYLEVVASRRLVMSWRWTSGGVSDEAGETSRVEIDLRATDLGTELTLTHSRLRTEASRQSHQRGWTGSLDKLVRLFERAVSPPMPITEELAR